MTPDEIRRENLEHFLGCATLDTIAELLDTTARELIVRAEPGARNLLDTVRMLTNRSEEHRAQRRLAHRPALSAIFSTDCHQPPE